MSLKVIHLLITVFIFGAFFVVSAVTTCSCSAPAKNQIAPAAPATSIAPAVPAVPGAAVPGAAVAPIAPVAPVSPAPAQSLPLYVDMCVCDCERVVTAYAEYVSYCPIAEIAKMEADFKIHCAKVENTEDCEYFKKLDGKLTDKYKNCRDQLDSMHDDCEECGEGKCKYE